LPLSSLLSQHITVIFNRIIWMIFQTYLSSERQCCADVRFQISIMLLMNYNQLSRRENEILKVDFRVHLGIEQFMQEGFLTHDK